MTRLTPAPQRWPRPHVRWILVREYGDGLIGTSVHSNALFRTRTEAREHAALDKPMILHAIKVEVPRRWRLSSAWGRRWRLSSAWGRS